MKANKRLNLFSVKLPIFLLRFLPPRDQDRILLSSAHANHSTKCFSRLISYGPPVLRENMDIIWNLGLTYKHIYHDFKQRFTTISGVMVSVLASSELGSSWVPQSGQTKDYNISMCCFSATQTACRSKNKDWLARMDSG